MDIIYLDNSATTKPHKEVTETMTDVMNNNYGNPSSLHTMGVAAERIVKCAREKVAKSLKASPSEIFFTSGGTESNNLAVFGSYNAQRIKGDIITTKVEHKSILEIMKNIANVHYLDVDGKGVINLSQLESLISENTALVSVMHVNNECGAIQPIDEIARIIKSKNQRTLFHVDAVQSYRKLDIPKNAADLISVSAHKIHGPKGIGALYVRKGVKISPLIYGGGQEKNIRSGTENTPAIAGFGIAASIQGNIEHIRKLNGILRGNLKDVHINSTDGSPYIFNFSAEGIRSEILLHSLEQRGIMVSSGSACSSNRPSPSHVLTAMGLSRQLIDSSIRISFSSFNTEEEVFRASEIINEVILNLRKQLGRK